MAKDLNRRGLRFHSWFLFFNIFINNLFHFIETTTLCNYANDKTMYSLDKNFNTVISRLRHDVAIIPEWFYKNYMMLNPCTVAICKNCRIL